MLLWVGPWSQDTHVVPKNSCEARVSVDSYRLQAWGPCDHVPHLLALTICPTHTLAASIMAPSAMERADSFSMWGFPDSSSSTTCWVGQRCPVTPGGLGQGHGARLSRQVWKHTLHFDTPPG